MSEIVGEILDLSLPLLRDLRVGDLFHAIDFDGVLGHLKLGAKPTNSISRNCFWWVSDFELLSKNADLPPSPGHFFIQQLSLYFLY